jgi:hypothetical protein
VEGRLESMKKVLRKWNNMREREREREISRKAV